MSGRSKRRNSPTSNGTRSRSSEESFYETAGIRGPPMFEIVSRGGLGRRGIWTRDGRTLTTPLVLHLHGPDRPAPEFAEALFVTERTEDPRFQVRTGGSVFAPRPPR